MSLPRMADVDSGPVEDLKGYAVFEGGCGHVVEDKADVLNGEEPGVSRSAGAIEHCVSDALDVLPAAFREVLVLHKGFALPVVDSEGAEDVFDAFAGFDGGVVAKQATWGATLTDVVLKGAGEFLLGFHAVCIADKGGDAAEELRHGGAVVDGGGVGVDRISCDCFVAARCIDGGIRRFEPLA